MDHAGFETPPSIDTTTRKLAMSTPTSAKAVLVGAGYNATGMVDLTLPPSSSVCRSGCAQLLQESAENAAPFTRVASFPASSSIKDHSTPTTTLASGNSSSLDLSAGEKVDSIVAGWHSEANDALEEVGKSFAPLGLWHELPLLSNDDSSPSAELACQGEDFNDLGWLCGIPQVRLHGCHGGSIQS